MRIIFVLIAVSCCITTVLSQTIPNVETTFNIQKKEKQMFRFYLQKDHQLRAMVMQQGIDLSISIYKTGDTDRLAFYDSPNGENGPEPISFDGPASDNYTMVVQQIDEDSVSEGKYMIRQVSIRALQAKLDTAFAGGSGIGVVSLTPVKIENLTNLAMLWGFLKYHHPAIARCDYNWDAALFRVLPGILSAQTKTEANIELEKWVDRLGKPDSCKTCKAIAQDIKIKMMPDYGFLFRTGNLPSSLIGKLTFIKNNSNQDENYYVDLAAGIGNPVFDHEDHYEKMVYPDAGYRLLSLFRYWNIIQYFYPYKYLIGEDWNNLLSEFIPKFISARDETQYALACLEIIARVHDTHANVWGNNQALNNYFGRYLAPIQTRFIENKLVVTGYYSDTLSIKDKLKTGDVITKINGRVVEQLVKDNLYLTAASNYEKQLGEIPNRSLLRSRRDTMTLDILRERKKMTVSVICVESTKLNLGLDYNPSPKDSSYTVLAGNIGYIFPGRYKDSQLPAIIKAFQNTRGLIIDMRTYPSEFMPFSFGAYLKPSPSQFVKFTTGDITNPGLFTFGEPLSNGVINPDYYKGPVVELVNSITVSQAEYTTMAFQTAPDLTVIGSMTAGADGNVSTITLPGGITTWISGIGVYYPNGDETQRKGIKIDREIKPTIDGIKNGRDELLDKAIEIIMTRLP
jgi:Peptidase family S41